MLLSLLTAAAFAGDAALWYRGNTEHTEGLTDETAAQLLALGASRVDEEERWPGDLSDYRLVMLVGSSEPYDDEQLADLAAFRAGGGLLVLVSDAMDGSDEDFWDGEVDDVFNALLEGWGAASRFREQALDRGCPHFASPLTEHTLLEGVGEPYYAYSGALVADGAGTALLEGESGQQLVVVEDDLVLMADTTLFPREWDEDDDDKGCVSNESNDALLANLFAASCQDTTDLDGDGVRACDDCDDSDASLGAWQRGYLDEDGDGYGGGEAEFVCGELGELIPEGGDCDDTDAEVNPGAAEIPRDGVDNDCDRDTEDREDDDREWDDGDRDDDDDGDSEDTGPGEIDDGEGDDNEGSADGGAGTGGAREAEASEEAKGCAALPSGAGGLVSLLGLVLGWSRRRRG